MQDKMRDALNKQVQRELQAAYLYLSLSNWYEEEALPGFASWMRAQAAEEYEHAMRIVDHLHERDARVEYGALEAPTASFGSPRDALKAALEHERKVTGHIHDLYDLAVAEADHASRVMLEWFVEEQVEEEHTFTSLLERMDRAGDSGAGLLVLDDVVGERGEA